MTGQDEAYMELRMLGQQLQSLQEYMQKIEEQVGEVATLIQAINEFSEIKKGNTALVPLTNGIFAEAELDPTKKLKVNVGAGIVVEKTPEDAVKLVEEQHNELVRVHSQAAEQFQQLAEQFEIKQAEFEEKYVKGHENVNHSHEGHSHEGHDHRDHSHEGHNTEGHYHYHKKKESKPKKSATKSSKKK